MFPKTIKKTNGEEEDFSAQKLVRSVEEAGGDHDLAMRIERELVEKGQNVVSTDEIHKYVYDYLKQEFSPLAARYNIRRAITDLGPSGFPFEKFVGAILEELGYGVQLNQMIKGGCIRHEVDFVATEGGAAKIAKPDGQSYIGEVKFHRRTGLKSDSKVALYIKSRFEDIVANQDALRGRYGHIKQAWLVTNTKFSKDAVRYAECQGMKITSWDYPKGEGLGKLIDRLGIHPITALTRLSANQKEQLMNKGVVLCRQLPEKPELLGHIGLSDQDADTVIHEAQAVCELRNTLE